MEALMAYLPHVFLFLMGGLSLAVFLSSTVV
jgi:hypothetical protein